MSSKAIYHIIEKDRDTWLYAVYGANALSPLLRLAQAQEIAEQMTDAPGIGHIFAHLTYDGKYTFPRLPEEDMFCTPIPADKLAEYNRMFRRTMEIDMRITLDIPQNKNLLEFNYNAPSFRLMDNYAIPIDVGLDNVAGLCKAAGEQGINDFDHLCSLYYRATGLEAALAGARANHEVEQLYTSEARAEAAARLRELEPVDEMEV